VTNTGDRVVGDGGPIQFQSTDNGISINPDGTITAREGGNSRNDSARGRLRLVRFDNVQQLQKEGTTMFSTPAGVAPLEAGTSSRVKQGSIEQSNVHSVIEMSRMIEVTRTYTQVTAMMQQFSDLRRSAVEKLAEVPA
jgi:flagellar hook-basal body protein